MNTKIKKTPIFQKNDPLKFGWKTPWLMLCLAASLAAVSASGQTVLFSFPFNESSGTNTYSTANSLVGTLGIGLVDVEANTDGSNPIMTNSAPAFSSDSPSGLAGDGAIAFDYINAPYAGERIFVDDANGVVTVADNNGINDFTFQCWVKFNTVPTDRSTLFDCVEPGLQVNIAIMADRSLVLTTYGDMDVMSHQTIRNDSQWHHIAIVHQDGVQVLFYIDGILRAAVPYTDGVLNYGGPYNSYFNIGGEVWNWPYTGSMVHPFVGSLDRMSLTQGLVAATNLDWTPIPGVNPPSPSIYPPQKSYGVSWATLPAGYNLQSTTNSADTNSWVTVDPSLILTGPGAFYHYYYGVSASSSPLSFRLVKP